MNTATERTAFEHAVTAIIVANSAVMLSSLFDHAHEELIETVDSAFLRLRGSV
jgi:hypothetical protein